MVAQRMLKTFRSKEIKLTEIIILSKPHSWRDYEQHKVKLVDTAGNRKGKRTYRLLTLMKILLYRVYGACLSVLNPSIPPNTSIQFMSLKQTI
jgi:hypothetical protein